MSPDELIARLRELGVKVSPTTLRRWARIGLVPAPVRRALGRGHGSYAEYSVEALAAAYACAYLRDAQRKAPLKGFEPVLSDEGLKQVVDLARNPEELLHGGWQEIAAALPPDMRKRMEESAGRIYVRADTMAVIAQVWLRFYSMVRDGHEPGTPLVVWYERGPDGEWTLRSEVSETGRPGWRHVD